ncbi:ABC transporter ATP-binding protein [Hymenobacter oligotrophus]|uniref:ABC transporter ATP-binding protein n=1 Tax=Hymenobacter oligotrophus TaxID=2319843 RepID=A0A3B7RS33_9BACT|nr:ABC transporter ATP-binding protein [Hymenobacter oligotrophus]AYA36947.1 ABC transporter ATP-binding protein [Hymenobacter oligotrophus]
MLQVSHINFQEEGNFGLRDISFTQQRFQKLAIAGETGSGKSTLLQTIAGLVSPGSGEVWFEGQRVEDPHEKLIPGHKGIAYLSQQFELPKFLRVEQVLQYANALPAGEAETLYEVCQISHLLKRKTNQLSGGERQRIALAKLLLGAPRLLLLDEPFSNLDIGHKTTLKAVIRDISERLGITCTLISHDPLDTLSWADEILVMQHGAIVQRGTPQQVYQQPTSEYVAGLFGGYNLLRGAAQKALAKHLGLRPNRKALLLRPENLRLVAPGQGLAGTVTEVNYYGSYYELRAELAGASVVIRTTGNGLAVGAAVHVAVPPEAVWYV